MKKQVSVIGIDLAKSVFHVAGMDPRGAVVLRQRLSREAVMGFITQLPLMEFVKSLGADKMGTCSRKPSVPSTREFHKLSHTRFATQHMSSGL